MVKFKRSDTKPLVGGYRGGVALLKGYLYTHTLYIYIYTELTVGSDFRVRSRNP